MAGRKKRLHKLIFPHMMTLGIFDNFNAKVMLAQDSEGCSGTSKSNIFLCATWKVTSGTISWTTFLKLFVCAFFQLGAVIEVLWHSGMASWNESVYDSPFKTDDSAIVCGGARFTTCLCAIMIYMKALDDIFSCLQSIALMAWADHYDDFTHHSEWFDSVSSALGSTPPSKPSPSLLPPQPPPPRPLSAHHHPRIHRVADLPGHHGR